ncbi:hypothetical protein SM124_13345 [Bacillus sp. 31A1R]|uniref:Uncharacterized protein n=1 Tax=Robertmurraya mangrovi TaxID=3098077 RepID=A0ABU5IZX2_9BACI|nr:hypothetical protein [Bacillus sp. 31A1R]MDZ5472713.1 hypothetical protein [Bacillus sp. 31A1R]
MRIAKIFSCTLIVFASFLPWIGTDDSTVSGYGLLGSNNLSLFIQPDFLKDYGLIILFGAYFCPSWAILTIATSFGKNPIKPIGILTGIMPIAYMMLLLILGGSEYIKMGVYLSLLAGFSALLTSILELDNTEEIYHKPIPKNQKYNKDY